MGEPHKGGPWGVNSGLVGLHKKGELTGGSFTLSRDWLALGGTVPAGQQGPRCQNIRIQRHA